MGHHFVSFAVLDCRFLLSVKGNQIKWKSGLFHGYVSLCHFDRFVGQRIAFGWSL